MRNIYLLAIFLFIHLSASSQDIVKANGSWLNTKVEYKWNKKLEFELAQSTRYDDLVGAFNSSHTTFKTAYELADWLKVIAGYRYMYRSNNDRKFNRYQLALQARTNWNDIRFTWRTRFEYRKAIQRDREITRLRNRLTTRYKIKGLDLDARVFLEYWYTFDEPLKDFSKYRIGTSLSKEIVDNLDLRLGYNFDADINQDELEQENIIVLGLTYNFKRK